MKTETMNQPTFKQGDELRVEITGYQSRVNKYIPPGTIGRLVVVEASVEGGIIFGNFYADDTTGFGQVMWPLFKLAK